MDHWINILDRQIGKFIRHIFWTSVAWGFTTLNQNVIKYVIKWNLFRIVDFHSFESILWSIIFLCEDWTEIYVYYINSLRHDKPNNVKVSDLCNKNILEIFNDLINLNNLNICVTFINILPIYKNLYTSRSLIRFSKLLHIKLTKQLPPESP